MYVHYKKTVQILEVIGHLEFLMPWFLTSFLDIKEESSKRVDAKTKTKTKPILCQCYVSLDYNNDKAYPFIKRCVLGSYQLSAMHLIYIYR